MTSLENFLKLMPMETNLISGFQQSPSDLYLVYSSEHFFKIIEFFPQEQILFRFAETKPINILIIHLIYYNLPDKVNLTFEIKDYDENVTEQLKQRFPASELYF
ncbi:MAG: hypothetical protein ACXACP_12035 [Candidatus Hodarchaeales archaeon]|jgi:hypothetical protein